MLRSEIARPLQAAQELVRAGKFDEALARIREAEAVPDRTPGESLAIERLRGVAASGVGDVPTATRSFEAVIAAVEKMGLQAAPIPGSERTAIGVLGNKGYVDDATIRDLPRKEQP